MAHQKANYKKRSRSKFPLTYRKVYRPESQLRHPLQLFRIMGQDLLASRELAWRLLVRDIRAQYRQSFLGLFWAFTPAILTALTLTFARNAGVVNIGDTPIAYPAYVMFSMSLWQTFSEAVTLPVSGVVNAKPMIAKISFPRESIILAKIGEVLFNFSIKLLLIIGLFIVFRVSVPWSVLLAPVAILHLVLFGISLSLFFAPIGALYGDVSRALPVIMAPWLLLTPVLYPPPESGLFSVIVNLNPVTPLLVTVRELCTTGILTHVSGFWFSSMLTFILLLFGWLFFRLSIPVITERISA